MATLGTHIYTLLYGKRVGRDEFGNRYYKSSANQGEHVGRNGVERRWVLYKGKAEPSKVPPPWHAWLHYITNDVPENQAIKRHRWQKDHVPNLTGTDYAYRPPGHIKNGGKREKATGDYTPWEPK